MSKLFFLFPALLYSFSSFACGCSPLPFNELSMKEFNSYDAVMKAIVLESNGPELEKKSEKSYDESYDYEAPPQEPTTYKLKVTKSIKGQVARNSKLVMEPSSKFDYYCTFNKIEVGKTYYFFVNKENGKLTTTYTSRVIAPKGKLSAEKQLCSIDKKMGALSSDDHKYKSLENSKTYTQKQIANQQETLKFNLAFLNKIGTNKTQNWYTKFDRKEAKGKLVNAQPEGYWEYYHYDGTVMEEGTHKKNSRHGLWTSYFSSGKISSKTIYKNNKKDGEEITYYKTGETRQVFNYTNGKKEGVQKMFHKNGKLYTSIPYSNDKIHGIRTGYSQSGNISSSKPYKNGVPDGQFITYYEDGSQASSETFKEGKIVGESVAHYPSGALKHKLLRNAEGKPVGEWIYYKKDGSIQLKRTYDFEGNLVNN